MIILTHSHSHTRSLTAAEDVLDNVSYAKAYSSDHQMQLLEQVAQAGVGR